MRPPTIPAPEGFYGCTICREIKPVSEFYAQKGGPGGHCSCCKVCRRAARIAYRAPADSAKFWARVDKSAGEDGCWLWTGPTHSENGYGLFGFDGRTRLTHRIALSLAGIEVPAGMVTDHLCRNRLCCNVKHLEIVTQRENVHRGQSVWARNAAKTHCSKGHPFSPENSAHKVYKGLTRHGHRAKADTRMRICLTCNPSAWRYAVIERPPPPRAKFRKYVGPQF